MFDNNIKVDNTNEIKLSDSEIVDAEVNRRRWTNRRRMSWISFAYLLTSGLAPFILDIKEAYIPLITNSQFLFFGIVATYIGGNVIEHIKMSK
jgi:hypothetical protein